MSVEKSEHNQLNNPMSNIEICPIKFLMNK